MIERQEPAYSFTLAEVVNTFAPGIQNATEFDAVFEQAAPEIATDPNTLLARAAAKTSEEIGLQDGVYRLKKTGQCARVRGGLVTDYARDVSSEFEPLSESVLDQIWATVQVFSSYKRGTAELLAA